MGEIRRFQKEIVFIKYLCGPMPAAQRDQGNHQADGPPPNPTLAHHAVHCQEWNKTDCKILGERSQGN